MKTTEQIIDEIRARESLNEFEPLYYHLCVEAMELYVSHPSASNDQFGELTEGEKLGLILGIHHAMESGCTEDKVTELLKGYTIIKKA